MAINTEAFIQSAAMQMKAQNAPGERRRERGEPVELSCGARERRLHSDLGTIYLHGSY